MRKLSIFIILALILANCSGASQTEATRQPTEAIPATEVPPPTVAPTYTPVPTSEPSATPMPIENPPAIQLLSGSPDTCSNPDDYSNVLGFDAVYYETTTESLVEYLMSVDEGDVIVESDTAGENKDGEEGWGFYPPAYDLPENTLITVELIVMLSADEDAPITSVSSITYNCTTGETIESSFERMDD